MNTIPPRYAHQDQTVQYLANNKLLFDMSDPGTGKTRTQLDAFAARKAAGLSNRMLVLCPKSIMQPSWGEDIEKYTPHLSYAIAQAGKKRAEAFESNADIVICNHDGVKDIVKNLRWLSSFTNGTLAVDESTAFKHRTSERSKALKMLSERFKYRSMMTGTPMPNGVLDIWHQMYVLDDGKRLGPQFFAFRSATCTPVQNGPKAEHVKWEDKPGAVDQVAELLEDITIRHNFEECLDIPKNVTRTVHFDLRPKHRKQYEALKDSAILEFDKGDVTAMHAATLTQKLLQLTSGAVYNEFSEPQEIANDRYELVIELVKEREHSIVAFNWKHQRDALIKLAEKEKITYAIIDGSVNNTARTDAVRRFQNGELQVIFAQPQSASHGLTLTRGTTTIWASPTYNAEHFQQFNRRIYRAGQTKKTETLLITASETLETRVYEVLSGKLNKMTSLLTLLEK